MYEWINGCMARYGLEIWRQRTNRIGHDITRYSDMFRYFWYLHVFATKEVKKFELRILLKVFHNGEAEAEQVVIAMESDPTSSQLWVFKVNRAELVQQLDFRHMFQLQHIGAW